MKMVFLDIKTIEDGVSLDKLKSLGELKVYPRTEYKDVIERIGDAEVIFLSKVKIDKKVLDSCKNLKFIGVAATGFNNVDLEECKKRGIAVTNVPAYSSESVAQHTFALILEIANNIGLHNETVGKGKWTNCEDFSFVEKPIYLLSGKSIGIIGYGSIGKKVAKIAEALGMNVNVYSKDKEKTMKSDIISLHCPATSENTGFVNKDFINNMKDGAILINTARGTLLNETDVAKALNDGKLSGVGVDVLSTEPPSPENPILSAENVFVTPHIAWSPLEMRKIVIETLYENLSCFLNGEELNRVV